MRIHTALLTLLLAGCAGIPAGREAVTPQRPTVSTGIDTTTLHTFEVEAGVVHDPSDRFETPVTLKYGVAHDLEIFSGFAPFVWVDQPGRDGRGPGDLSFGLRHRFLDKVGSAPGAAFRMATKLPTASPRRGLGSGRMDFSAAGTVEWDAGEVALTAFYDLGFLGQEEPRDLDLRHTFAFAAQLPLEERTWVLGEFAHVYIPEQDLSAASLLAGGRHALGPALALDAAFRIGLSRDAPDFEILVGVVYNLGSPLGPWR